MSEIKQWVYLTEDPHKIFFVGSKHGSVILVTLVPLPALPKPNLPFKQPLGNPNSAPNPFHIIIAEIHSDHWFSG